MTPDSRVRSGAAAPTVEELVRAREPNQGSGCTSACVLTVLRAMGAVGLPPLAEATRRLGAAAPLGPPPLGTYLPRPGRPGSPLDRRIEALARECGLEVRSRTRLALPWPAPRPRPHGCLIANLAWGQERPGHHGTWGWNALLPRTYAAGGHSVVFAGAGPGGRRLVVDPNWPGLQHWAHPGWSLTVTRIARLA